MTQHEPLEADILVAGGGTAGCAAAIAAARRGHKVVLVEEANCLGGTSTTGGVGEWFANLDGMGDIFAAVVAGLDEFGARLQGRFFHPEYLKIVWQMLAERAGVRVLLHASVHGADTDAGRVRRLHVLSCSQPLTAAAKYFIDATGEGDLAAAAGATFVKGDPQHGRTLHMTLTFTLYDTGRPVRPHLPAGLAEIASEADLPGLHVWIGLGDGRVYCNATKVMLHDPTDPLSLSDAELEGRRQVARVLHFLNRTKFPNHALASTGASIGIREGRRVIGEHVLTESEVLGGAARSAADGIAVATSQIDFHSLTRPGNTGWRQQVDPYPIPLRCLIARGWQNLLMAGKCISVDQVVHSSMRMTPTCCAMGQAAGTAVAMALEKGLADIRCLDVKELQPQLRTDGLELDPARHKPFSPHQTPRDEAV